MQMWWVSYQIQPLSSSFGHIQFYSKLNLEEIFAVLQFFVVWRKFSAMHAKRTFFENWANIFLSSGLRHRHISSSEMVGSALIPRRHPVSQYFDFLLDGQGITPQKSSSEIILKTTDKSELKIRLLTLLTSSVLHQNVSFGVPRRILVRKRGVFW